MQDQRESPNERLRHFLYDHTASEEWHLAHPGEPSPRFERTRRVTIGDANVMLFDWEETLQEGTVGLIKETRFTTVPPHVNRDMELSLVYDGSCDFVVADRHITLTKGDVIIFDTDVVRSSPTYKDEHDIVISMVFRREFFDSVFLSQLPGSGLLTELVFENLSRRRRRERALVIPAEYAGRAKPLLEFIAEECIFSEMYSNELTRSYVQALFIELVRGLYLQDQQREVRRIGNGRLQEVMQRLEANYKDCTLASLAREFGYNPNYLGNLLRQASGRTFSELKLSQQLSEARFLLANTDRSVTSIAEKVGITNMTYFYRKFRKLYRMSPKEHRLQSQINSPDQARQQHS